MSDPKQGMWRRSDKELQINLDGHVFLMYQDNDQPVLGRMGNTMFLAVFSTVEKLEEYRPILNPPRPTKIKQVQEGGSAEFIDSIHQGGVRIMIDPYIHNGNTRFTMVKVQCDE